MWSIKLLLQISPNALSRKVPCPNPLLARIAPVSALSALLLHYTGWGLAGLSAADITSGLATTGAIVGGGMAAGIFVLAAAVAGLAAAGVGVIPQSKNQQLHQEKERLYKEVLARHEAIIKALKAETDASKERLDYLQSLNILRQQAVKDLRHDIGAA